MCQELVGWLFDHPVLIPLELLNRMTVRRGNCSTQSFYLYSTVEHRITPTSMHASSGIRTHNLRVRKAQCCFHEVTHSAGLLVSWQKNRIPVTEIWIRWAAQVILYFVWALSDIGLFCWSCHCLKRSKSRGGITTSYGAFLFSTRLDVERDFNLNKSPGHVSLLSDSK